MAIENFDNGTAGRIILDSNIDVPANTQNFTIIAFAETETLGDDRLMSKASSTGINDHWWMVGMVSNDPKFRLKTTGSTLELNAGVTTVVINTLHLFGFTYDGSDMRNYLDEAEATSRAITGDMAIDNTVPVAIGDGEHTGREWDGIIYEIRGYLRVLSLKEIASIYNSNGKMMSHKDLFFWYKLDEKGYNEAASGIASVKDFSPNRYHGTPEGVINYTGSRISTQRRMV